MNKKQKELFELVVHQQEEKKGLLSQKFIRRNVKAQFFSHLDSTLVKVILGPRRSGKSTFAIHAMQSYLKNKEFLYINFDSRELLLGEFSTQDYLTVFKEFKTKFLFLDEVQNINDFQLLVNSFKLT